MTSPPPPPRRPADPTYVETGYFTWPLAILAFVACLILGALVVRVVA